MKRGLLICGALAILALVAQIGILWRVQQLLDRADAELLVYQRPERAETESRILLWWDADHPQGLLIHGISLHQQSRFDEALSFLERVRENSPFRQEAETMIISTLMKLHLYQRAEAYLIDYLGRFPDDDSMRSSLHAVYLQTMRVEDALHVYEERLTENGSDDLPLLLLLLDVIAEPVSAGGVKSSIEQHCRFLDQEPTALAALGRASALLGATEAANDYFRHAIRESPQDPRILLWASGFFLTAGQTGAASATLNHCPEPREPSNRAEEWNRSEYLRLKAELARHDGDWTEALEHIEASLNARTRPVSLTLKASLLRRLGRPDDAADVMRKLASLGDADVRLIQLHSTIRTQPLTESRCLALANALRQLGHRRQAQSWTSAAGSIGSSSNPRTRRR